MREIGHRLLMELMNSPTSVMGSQVSIWPTSSGKTQHRRKREDTDMDDPLEQMIQRVPHTLTEVNDTIINHHTFVTDNKMFFDKLVELTRDYECWTYIKPCARARNGRAAYMAFNQYLGPDNIDNMAATAEHMLINATYRGEGRHWNLESMPHCTRNNILSLRN